MFRFLVLIAYSSLMISSTRAFVGIGATTRSLISKGSSWTIRQPSVLFAESGEDQGLSAPPGPLDRPLLALVDAVALTGFAAVGKASHSGPNGAIELSAVLQTAFPFLLSWFVTSPLTGVYKETERSENLALATVKQLLLGWAVAIPLGCVLRGLIKGYIPPTSFIVVTLIATLVILTVSRVAFAIAEDFFVEMVN
mmetsp:Transcript_24094/g.45808  ORF Transcript_24094/g.45808 Transcript_24094/m.45808 type:complete len:196 (-) Transcript_24094:180-767(-)